VNPFIKNKYCVYSSYYIIDNTSRNVCDLRFKYITNNLVPNLLNFYIALEDLEDDSFYDKNYARTNIINFFNFICFKEPYIYAEQLKKYAKSDDKKFIRFVNLYINDLSNVFDETFTLIRDINKIEKEDITVSLLNKIEIYNDRPKLKELYKKYKYADSFLSTLRFMLSFLMTLSKYCDNILMCNELGAKFCSQINYFLNELTNVEKRKFYIIKNKYDIDFQPLHLLNYLSQVYLNLISHDNFTSFMSNDLRSFRKENIKFLCDKLWSNNMITDNEGLRLNKMSEKVEQLIEKEKQDLQVPDEFCDPLMASEINEPIILPGTETIMEKSVISRHLLTDQHNPFNREKLTLEELEKFNSQESIQLKIKDFMARKNKWKLNN
jgi:ubiquitin conjugation factor E4 B